MNFHAHDWIDLENPTPEELAQVAQITQIPIRELKQAADIDERPRVTVLENFLSVIFKSPKHRKTDMPTLNTSAIGFFISEKLLITVHHSNVSVKKFFEKRDFMTEGLITTSMRIMDDCAHEYFLFLDKIEEKINSLEDRMLETGKDNMKEIFRYKKTLIYFHKALNANLEAVRRLEKEEIIEGKALTIARYLHDDIFQLIDMSATYRELLTGTLEVHLNTINTNMNRVMKRMTAWTTLILLPTFFTGLYGMNFHYMPELSWKYGYAVAWFLIITSIVSLLIYFRKKDWF